MSHHHLTGLSAWLVQRLSAVFMLGYVAIVAVIATCQAEIDHQQWRNLMAQPLFAIATTMFFLAMLMHIWVGVRDVILDYAGHYPMLRLMLLALLGAWLIALGIWLIRIMTMVMT